MSLYVRSPSFVDQYALSPRPPTVSINHPHLPTGLRPLLLQAKRLSRLFDTAFPASNDKPPSFLTLQSFHRAVRILEDPINALVAPLEHHEIPDLPFIHNTAETQIPSLLVSMLARVLIFLSFSDMPKSVPISSVPEVWRPYIPIIKHTATQQIINFLVVNLLRAINTLAASSDLLTRRLAEDSRLLPLLFASMRVPNAVELSLALLEEALHSAPIRLNLDLSTINDLPAIVNLLTPFQLGLFCRILAPLVDERDVPLCGGDHCTGACTLPSHVSSNDWQRIEPATDQLRTRRSYLKSANRALRDRNHSVLLAIPGLLQKLVKLIAVPPGPRDELLMADYAIGSGIFTLNFDSPDMAAEEAFMEPGPEHAALVAVPGGPNANIVFEQHPGNDDGGAPAGNGPPAVGVHGDMHLVMDLQPLPPDDAPAPDDAVPVGYVNPYGNLGQGMEEDQGDAGPAQGGAARGHAGGAPAAEAPRAEDGAEGEAGERAEPLPSEEQIGRRVFYMVFRRVTGMDSRDAQLAGTQSWAALDKRISRVEREHARGSWDGKVFREKRRRSTYGTLGVGLRLAPGENHGFIDVPAVPNIMAGYGGILPGPGWEDGDGAPENASEQGTGGSNAHSLGGQAESEAGLDGEEEAMSSELSISGLLMSSHQVEILFVLYSLLIGRRKVDVQDVLIESGIFPVLSRFCDSLDWTESRRETKTEESLKLHYIRLLHYICDGLQLEGDRLDLLFSEEERARLRAIESCTDTDVGSTVVSSPASPMSFPEVSTFGFNSLSLSSSPIEDGMDFMGIKHIGAKRGGRDGHPQVMTAISLSLPCESRRASERRRSVTPRSPPGTSHHAETTKDVGLRKAASHSMKNVRDLEAGSRAQSIGLICKVTRVLTKNHGRLSQESTRRHLLSGCIESFLRGATCAQKTLMAEEGLLAHLLHELSESAKVPGQWAQFRQTSFDLLGQLIKWNRLLFFQMNEMFRRNPKLLPNVLEAVSDRLVDSNVFVRSLVISLERFRFEDHFAARSGEPLVPYDFGNCQLWEFLETFRVRLLHDLLGSVRVEDLNFENICCVNTSLILLVTSCGTEQSLDLFLSETAEMVLDSAKAQGGARQRGCPVQPVNVFDNLLKLINFWLNYYQFQSTDVASKELSSNIRFERLVAMAVALKERLPKLSMHVKKYAEMGLSREQVYKWD
eukprot:GFKZ01005639.1.p1 GENE.GFKZ01005639.1~~GFKZ01005639.1.p1  ORF type:complete len:1184 (-),score=169.31 GFKZ01005639.1:922-4473(-)